MTIFRKENLSVGLALGGGGARGLAHIGVLKILEQEKIPIDFIVGTSMGSIIGAMYTQHVNATKVENLVLNYIHSEVFQEINLKLPIHKARKEKENRFLERMFTFFKHQYVLTRSFTHMGLYSQKILDHALKILLENEDIRDTRIPFAAVTTDVWSGHNIILKEGSIRKAVAASSTIPGMFSPVEWNKWWLIDGGVSNLVPVRETFEVGAEVVIAVDVTKDLITTKEFNNGLEIMFRADEISNYRLNKIHLKDADVVIRPQVGDAHWANFNIAGELIKLGEEATEEKLENIHKIIHRPLFNWFSKRPTKDLSL